MPAKILIIEDNPANMELMRYLLVAFGHIVTGAEDGAEGIETARREVPDLIVCDVQLPVMDGTEVARVLKGDASLARIPLIGVTALAMVGDEEKLMASGFDGYIAKPIEPETFVSQIEAYLKPELRFLKQPRTDGRSEPGSASPSRSNQLILIVDDHPVNVELAVSLLERSGYRAISADNVTIALELARRHRPDVILSDVNMQNGDGYDFLRDCKADSELSAIPFVLISSTWVDPRHRNKGIAMGAIRYLIRPIEPERLLAEIDACLQP